MKNLKLLLLAIACVLLVFSAQAQRQSTLTVTWEGVTSGPPHPLLNSFSFYLTTTAVSYFHNFPTPSTYTFTFINPIDISWSAVGGTLWSTQTYSAWLANPTGVYSWWIGNINGTTYYLYREKISNVAVKFWIGT